MKGKSIFTIIGIIVFVIIALVVIYFAWVGWRERGKPVPEVDVDRQGALHRQQDPVFA